MESTKIKLTEAQLESLTDLQQIIDDEHLNGTPGAIMAQVYPNEGCIVCRFVSYDNVKKMYEAMGKKFTGEISYT